MLRVSQSGPQVSSLEPTNGGKGGIGVAVVASGR